MGLKEVKVYKVLRTEPGTKEEQSQCQLRSFSSSEVKEQSVRVRFPPLILRFLGLACGSLLCLVFGVAVW